MNPNIKAVRYYDAGYRLGILVRDDERRQHIIPIAVQEIRVKKYRTDLEEVVTEYLDTDVLKSLVTKIKQLGKKYGITEEARRYIA